MFFHRKQWKSRSIERYNDAKAYTKRYQSQLKKEKNKKRGYENKYYEYTMRGMSHTRSSPSITCKSLSNAYNEITIDRDSLKPREKEWRRVERRWNSVYFFFRLDCGKIMTARCALGAEKVSSANCWAMIDARSIFYTYNETNSRLAHQVT